MDINNHYDAIVIGAGPAGLTAGIYLSRAKLKTLIVNEGMVGGQLVEDHAHLVWMEKIILKGKVSHTALLVMEIFLPTKKLWW